jgi:hypothetical protein
MPFVKTPIPSSIQGYCTAFISLALLLTACHDAPRNNPFESRRLTP